MAKLVDRMVNNHASTCVIFRIIGFAILAISMMIVLCGGELFYIGFIISAFSLAFFIPALVFELTALNKKARDKILKGEIGIYRDKYNKAKEIHDNLVILLQQHSLKLEDFKDVNYVSGDQNAISYYLYQYGEYILYTSVDIETLIMLNDITVEEIIEGKVDEIYFASSLLKSDCLKGCKGQYALGKRSGVLKYETICTTEYVKGKKPSLTKMMINEELFGTAYAVTKYQEEKENQVKSHYKFYYHLLLKTVYGDFVCSTSCAKNIESMLIK